MESPGEMLPKTKGQREQRATSTGDIRATAARQLDCERTQAKTLSTERSVVVLPAACHLLPGMMFHQQGLCSKNMAGK